MDFWRRSFSRFTQSFSRFIRNVNGEKKTSRYLMIFCTHGYRNASQYWGWGLEEGSYGISRLKVLYWMNFPVAPDSAPFRGSICKVVGALCFYHARFWAHGAPTNGHFSVKKSLFHSAGGGFTHEAWRKLEKKSTGKAMQ